MEIANLIPHIESLIFASEKPLTNAEITDLINSAFGFMEDKLTTEQIEAALEGIVEKYRSEFYPFEVRQSGGGWQFLTKKDFHKTVAQLNGEKFLKRLSGAALETLAIIAYKQPITKGEIEGIRGVSTDYTIQKLLEKELIVISGRNEQMPGHPLVYSTSKSFMDYFGLNSTDDLPKIREVLADQIVEPTVVNHTELDTSETLSVSDSGELIDADTEAPDEEGTVNGHAFNSGGEERPDDTGGWTGDEPSETGPAPGELEIDDAAGNPEAQAFAEDLAEDAYSEAGGEPEEATEVSASEQPEDSFPAAETPDLGASVRDAEDIEDIAEEGAFGQEEEEQAAEDTGDEGDDTAGAEVSLNEPGARLFIDDSDNDPGAEPDDSAEDSGGDEEERKP